MAKPAATKTKKKIKRVVTDGIARITPEGVLTNDGKVREVDARVLGLVKLEVAQFRRVVVLPQGDFRQLLSADSQAREKLLEKLFDTLAWKRVEDELAQRAKRMGRTLQDAEQVRRGLRFNKTDAARAAGELESLAASITRRFAADLPQIRAKLVSDLHAAYQGDPAASSISEILLCYPGITAIIHYRLAHALHRLGVPLIARIVSELAHSATGIDIHPGAEIGSSFFIDHGTGVVIGETAVIGKRVRLYQAVTLGAKRFPVGSDGSLEKGLARHPIVEDDVVIYAGATVLGRITIGRGSSIGGNVWLTHSVPPGSQITQAQTQHSLHRSAAEEGEAVDD